MTLELKKKDEERKAVGPQETSTDVEAGELDNGGERRARWLQDIRNGVLLQAFTMTFLAEWGDRSQVTTVVLAATEVCFHGPTSRKQMLLLYDKTRHILLK